MVHEIANEADGKILDNPAGWIINKLLDEGEDLAAQADEKKVARAKQDAARRDRIVNGLRDLGNQLRWPEPNNAQPLSAEDVVRAMEQVHHWDEYLQLECDIALAVKPDGEGEPDHELARFIKVHPTIRKLHERASPPAAPFKLRRRLGVQ